MGVPNQFNDIIQRHLDVFAAWMPIVNKYGLGDYGIFADGVFSKLGNITEDFQVTFIEGAGSEASIDFTSEGASVMKFVGGTQVDNIPAGELNARIEIEFSKSKSFLVKSPTVTVATIDNVNEVAKKLKDTREWDGKWKVVYQVYNALDAVIISTIDSGTKLNFNGDASALGQMKLGSAGVNIDTNRALGLKISGKNGVIGLGLFRIKTDIFGGKSVVLLTDEIEGVEEEEDSAIILEPSEIEDDL